MWYIVQVGAGNEARMKELLEDFLPQGLISHVFYPLYESSYKKGGTRRTVTRVLFPGYLFLDVEHSRTAERLEELEERLSGLTQFHHLLTTGKVCTPVSIQEQDFLAKHTDAGYVVAMSRGYMAGREVTITEGAFAGYHGQLKYVDRHNRYGVMAVRLGERDVDMRFGLEIIWKESDKPKKDSA